MAIDYNALQNGTKANELPADGKHTARLERAALVETKTGTKLVTEWSGIDSQTYWTSWNGFDEMGWSYTIELLDGLGVDRSQCTDDDKFKEMLSYVEGGTFDVTTSTKPGTRGDRMFTGTYVNGRVDTSQATIDMPADTAGLVEPDSVPARLEDTETIPF